MSWESIFFASTILLIILIAMAVGYVIGYTQDKKPVKRPKGRNLEDSGE